MVLIPIGLDLCIGSLYVFNANCEPILQGSLLTLSWQRSLSFRNQSIDLLDWFLYDRDLLYGRVNMPLLFNSMRFYIYQEMGVASNFLKRQKPSTIIQQ